MTQLPLDREEYVEQAYFFRVLRERIEENAPVQEVLTGIREEILATTKLPLAIDVLIGDLKLKGKVADGMVHLPHYFTSFQTFIVTQAEVEESKFDFRVALQILEKEAELRSAGEVAPAALFVFHFECIARNRLGYDTGMLAVAADPAYPPEWKQWIERIRFDLGTVDFADMVYLRSQQHVDEVRRRRCDPEYLPSYPILFDVQAGRIARAHLGKDPLHMFAALQRQLGYPTVPRLRPPRIGPLFDPQTEMRFQRLEARLSLLEQEQRGGLDLAEFYRQQTVEFDDPEPGSRS
jgi:hypothetical protein